MAIQIHIIGKTHDVNGNPRYKLFIPAVTGKIDFLRKLKTPQQYSVQSYNISSTLRRAFNNQDIIIYDKYGDRI